jgi:hypothetical protein
LIGTGNPARIGDIYTSSPDHARGVWAVTIDILQYYPSPLDDFDVLKLTDELFRLEFKLLEGVAEPISTVMWVNVLNDLLLAIIVGILHANVVNCW